MSVLFLLFSLLGGCSTPQYECSETQACGLGSTCISGQCVAQECSTSAQCPIETYCTAKRQCETGCESDADCRFGDVCDAGSHQCTSTTCVSGRVDCSFGQFCSPDGECYDAGGYYCHPCSDDGDCGGNGNMCFGDVCGVTCSTNDDCPNGYSCVDVINENGSVVAHQCLTDCTLF